MPLDPANCFSRENIKNLIKNPCKPLVLKIGSNTVRCSIAIADIAGKIKKHFAKFPETDEQLKNMSFKHFGFIVESEKEINLDIFDKDLNLNPHLKYIIDTLGVCSIKNIKLENPAKKEFQKNIFPDLMFHIDRGRHFDNQYSLFYRNPDDPKHRLPRTTTSLIMPNAAAHLQAIKENCLTPSSHINSKLFTNVPAGPAIDEYMVEQKWDAPELNGEICFFDNRTVMHASYHHGDFGYQIAVQYLF